MACFSDLPSAGAGMGWWIAGIWGWGVCFVGVCFGSGISILGLHITYMMNVTSLIFLE